MGYGPYGGMSGWGSWGGGLMPFGGLFWLLLIGLAVAAAVWFARGRHPPPPELRPGDAGALAILEQRYARGEIERDEFLRKRRDMLDHGAT